MGRKDSELEPSKVVSAIRDALPNSKVVDLTPDYAGGDPLDPLVNGEKGVIYVLPNCKSVRKKMARAGDSAQKGSLRHAFEEHEAGVRRPFVAFFNSVKGVTTYGIKVSLLISLSEACESLAKLAGDKCVICHDPLILKSGRSMGCKHFFHDKCLWKWTRACCENGDYCAPCPLCRAPLNPDFWVA